MQYALRLCNQWKRFDACIVLYGELGLYEEAVDLALKVNYKIEIISSYFKHDDEELAGIYANRASENENMSRQMWLKISNFNIKNSSNIKG